MIVVAFEVKNYMNIESAKVDLEKGAYEIYGDNADGKTAFLEAIVAAFSGKRGMVKEPVRQGAERAEWFVDTGKFTIERTLTKSGSMKLTVKAADGTVYAKGQDFLDGFLNSMSFDPHAFSRMEPKQQAEVLRGIVGVDLSGFDAKIRELEASRLFVGRERDSLKGQADGLIFHEDAPEQEVSIGDLMGKLEKLQATNAAIRASAESAKSELMVNERDLSRARAEAEKYRSELEQIRQRMIVLERDNDLQNAKIAEVESERAVLEKAYQDAVKVPLADETPILEQLKNVQSVNAKVQENARRKEISASYRAKKKQYDDMTDEIEQNRENKKKALSESKLPVEGLSFDEAGVFYDGIPFSQISTGQRIRIGVQLFFASNPKLNLILVRDASLLDDKNKGVIIEEAAKRNAQVLLEVVGTRPTMNPGRAFTIIDGRIEFDGKETKP